MRRRGLRDSVVSPGIGGFGTLVGGRTIAFMAISMSRRIFHQFKNYYVYYFYHLFNCIIYNWIHRIEGKTNKLKKSVKRFMKNGYI
jgi:hypothetical protein